MSKMSGGRQTGTVPKTKHNTRARREIAVNHIPNNLDWHDPYPPQRARKESNTSASRHSDAGEDLYDENPWLGLAPPQHRGDDEELRWGNVKSSNLTPERSSSLANVDVFIAANRSMHRQENGPDDRESAVNKEALTRGRIKLKMEQSQRKIEELQQQQAALLSLRNKTIQQVKPVQIEELHQQPGPLMSLRNKAIQQVKPVQQEELDRSVKIDGRLQNMQEYANIIQVLEREETGNLEEGQTEQQLRKKLNDLIAKKAQVDSILAYIEADTAGEGAPSISSDDGDGSMFQRGHAGGDTDDRREVAKQDNREQATAAYLHMKELKLEEVKSKLEQLQTLLTRVERLKESSTRPNGETASHCSDPSMHPQVKNCPSNSVLEKLHAKKFDLEHTMRKAKSNPTGSVSQGIRIPSGVYNQQQLDSWSYTTHGNSQGSFHQNTADYSSDEAEADYDESPVKLCTSTLQPYLPQGVLPKARSQSEGISNGPHSIGKHSSGGTIRSDSSRPCAMHIETDDRVRQPYMPLQDMGSQANNSALALQISELQLQMEQMQILYQNILEKQHVNVFSAPHSCSLLPPNSMGFMQCMSPSTQWHQHQLLVNSLNQCCQLIWHQQRELAGLRQALTMLQEEGSMYKCPSAGYGNNLNFDAGLLWAQHSPQTLNNQVPPGNRANNYWDNFRSYSRQNLLSGRNKSNEGCLPDQLHPPRPSPQQENLRPKDNSGDIRGNSTRCRQQPLQHSNGPCTSEQNSRRFHRRFNASNNLKPDVGDVMSLEQSVYNELESVITESERSPDMLLQLVSQLRSIRCHQQENNIGNDCEVIEPGTPGFSRAERQRNQGSSLSFNHEIPKLETVIEELGRIIQECEICTPELLQQVVGFVLRAFHFPSHHDVVLCLEASLLKYQGTRISQVGDDLLCTIANIVSTHIPPMHSSPHGIDDRDLVLVEQIEEEGAVGGIPLQSSQHSTSQSVETELAEADQPQHNSADNAEVFDLDEGILPNLEILDNQEMPPRDENTEQPLQET